MNLIKIIVPVTRIVAGLVRATKAGSPGGRKITRDEWQSLLEDALASIGAILEEALGGDVE